jgi:DNA mismatch repair ATPase MutS
MKNQSIDKEALRLNADLLRRGAEEIKRLRHRLQIAEAQIDVLNLFATVLHTQPCVQPPRVETQDIAYSMLRRAEVLES